MRITLEQMDPILVGSNPYEFDHYNMGHTLGTNLVLMYANHSNQVCKYLILVNLEDGTRTRLIFGDDPHVAGFSDFMNMVMGGR